MNLGGSMVNPRGFQIKGFDIKLSQIWEIGGGVKHPQHSQWLQPFSFFLSCM